MRQLPGMPQMNFTKMKLRKLKTTIAHLEEAAR
jgi:hypothetical protein